jgi:hypothetical protein
LNSDLIAVHEARAPTTRHSLRHSLPATDLSGASPWAIEQATSGGTTTIYSDFFWEFNSYRTSMIYGFVSKQWHISKMAMNKWRQP